MSSQSNLVHPAVRDVAGSLQTALAEMPFANGSEVAPSPDSRWCADTSTTLPASADPDIGDELFKIVESSGFFRVAAGLDYVRGLESVLRSGSLYSTHLLGRGALEAFSYGAWLWAPGLVIEQRIIRGLLEARNAYTQEIDHCKRLRRDSKAMPLAMTTQIGQIHAASKQKLQYVRTDLAEMRRLVATRYGGTPAYEQEYPSAGKLVKSTLDNAFTRLDAGLAAYGTLSSVTHSNPLHLSNLLTVELDGQDARPHLATINVFDYLSPVYYAVVGMKHCLNRIVDCWGLEPIDDVVVPVLERLRTAMTQSGQEPLDIDVDEQWKTRT